MAQVEMSSGLRRNIRHFFSTSWEPPQGECGCQCYGCQCSVSIQEGRLAWHGQWVAATWQGSQRQRSPAATLGVGLLVRSFSCPCTGGR